MAQSLYDYPEFGWRIEDMLDDGKVFDTIAVAKNLRVAIAAFESAVKEKPHRHLRLMERGRILQEQRPTATRAPS